MLGQASLIRVEKTAPGQKPGSIYIVTLTHPERVSKNDPYPPTCLNLVEYHTKQEQFGIYDNFSAIWQKNGHKSDIYPISDTTTLVQKQAILL